jgi:hypothetical protein
MRGWCAVVRSLKNLVGVRAQGGEKGLAEGSFESRLRNGRDNNWRPLIIAQFDKDARVTQFSGVTPWRA